MDGIRTLLLNARTNPKAIWQYIKTKSKTKIGIGEIHVNPQYPNSTKIDIDQEEAQIFADYFNSVFTREPKVNIPVLTGT